MGKNWTTINQSRGSRRKRGHFEHDRRVAFYMAQHSHKPTIVLVHGMFSSPEALEPMAEYYRSLGYPVLNLPSPGGITGLNPAPGSAQSYHELDISIPPGSVVIGHSMGGNHVEEYAQEKARRGDIDTNQYITVASAFPDARNDNSANIHRIGYLADPLVNWNSRNPAYDQIIMDFGHGSGDWERWTPLIDKVILDHQMKSYGGFDPIEQGHSFYESLATGGR